MCVDDPDVDISEKVRSQSDKLTISRFNYLCDADDDDVVGQHF
jgi:hypothetical protein